MPAISSRLEMKVGNLLREIRKNQIGLFSFTELGVELELPGFFKLPFNIAVRSCQQTG
jgi:hypothetical protein